MHPCKSCILQAKQLFGYHALPLQKPKKLLIIALFENQYNICMCLLHCVSYEKVTPCINVKVASCKQNNYLNTTVILEAQKALELILSLIKYYSIIHTACTTFDLIFKLIFELQMTPSLSETSNCQLV